jgi:hypothetical protein
MKTLFIFAASSIDTFRPGRSAFPRNHSSAPADLEYWEIKHMPEVVSPTEALRCNGPAFTQEPWAYPKNIACDCTVRPIARRHNRRLPANRNPRRSAMAASRAAAHLHQLIGRR